MNLDGVASTPESNKTAKGKRTSLQKTLRDIHHNSSVSQRHRRNKESESTVRSADGEHSEFPEATPGLERAQGRFILHGKQASVVQFGDDWPTERMRLRREKWHREHSEPVSPGKEDTRGRVPGSPVVRDLVTDGTEDDTASTATGTAESFIDTPADTANATTTEPYNPTWDLRSDKRNTVIGPATKSVAPHESNQNNNTVNEEEDENEKDGEGDFEDAKENRRTVIGPSSLVFPAGMGSSSSEASGRVNGSNGGESSGDGGLPRAI